MPYPANLPLTANGNYQIDGYDMSPSSFFIHGNWGTATTASLEFSPDEGTTWIPVSLDLTILTANGGGNFAVACTPLRVVIASAGGGTSLNCRVQPLNMK